ncbi:DUF2752 domain-containing protein [Carboxylicivirga sp. N1Y90]|uniref:DUF2752 domain-containing protein n=1 Tax=Carboxylicivirga fragile TaxID=3417571 RepID=UPI003D33654B|nr:DUF2752 domain-containing protein [Marinilabiliaceae bacterium N1Y90]
MSYQFKKRHLEAYFWLLAIVLLAFTNPELDSHFSLCLLKNLGFDFCPGCGLGHSIAFIFRGRFAESWHTHPLAIPALLLLLYRSYSLLKPDIHFKSFNTKNYE